MWSRDQRDHPTRVEEAPLHRTLIGVARFNHRVQRIASDILANLKMKFGAKLRVGLSLISWMIEEAGRIVSRTSWQQNNKGLIQFGEKVFCKFEWRCADALRSRPCWRRGIWLGRMDCLGEHLLFDGERVHECRSFRRHAPRDQRHWDVRLINLLRCMPWDLSGERIPPPPPLHDQQFQFSCNTPVR